jgi:uncharacterized membrane protein YgdD (TMEM256/DUF423 family)
MRGLNIAAALSGAIALIMLVIASHALHPAPEDLERIHLGAFIQLIAAAAALAITSRNGVLNLIAGAMILGGAALFAAALYILAITHSSALIMLAPIGGITLIAGWVVLALTKPRD